MPQNIFKIYDGRTNFWQWDMDQKLIVLDDTVTEVHFSNKDMTYSIKRSVYEIGDEMRVCNIPNELLRLPRNLIAYAYADNVTIKSVKFAVIKRPMPNDYVIDQSSELDKVIQRLDLLEAMLKEVEQGIQEIKKFENIVDAEAWAQENKKSGIIIVIRMNSKWIAHIVEDDYSVTPICNCDGELVEVVIYDGGDSDGYDEVTEVIQIWDGGSAAGFI